MTIEERKLTPAGQGNLQTDQIGNTGSGSIESDGRGSHGGK